MNNPAIHLAVACAFAWVIVWFSVGVLYEAGIIRRRVRRAIREVSVGPYRTPAEVAPTSKRSERYDARDVDVVLTMPTAAPPHARLLHEIVLGNDAARITPVPKVTTRRVVATLQAKKRRGRRAR